MISIINSGYAPLRDVQILETNPWITQASSPTATAEYRLDTVTTSTGRRLPNDFQQMLGEIPSGESVNLLYNISTGDKKVSGYWSYGSFSFYVHDTYGLDTKMEDNSVPSTLSALPGLGASPPRRSYEGKVLKTTWYKRPYISNKSSYSPVHK
uniref:KTSC domain-containing protein n=1 Tax=Steinernema glaseri TaxID=37863 RepID=A0A1I7ZJU2_9BILA